MVSTSPSLNNSDMNTGTSRFSSPRLGEALADLPASPSLLWKSLFIADVQTIEDIAVGWGIARENSEMFASLTLLRPQHLRKTSSQPERGHRSLSHYEAQAGLKERLRSMLENEKLIPRASSRCFPISWLECLQPTPPRRSSSSSGVRCE